MLIAFVLHHQLPAGRDHPVPPARRSGRGRLRLGGARWRRSLSRRRLAVLAVFAVLAVAARRCSPRLTFDSDPLHTKNPNTEAMRTLRDLMNNPAHQPVQRSTFWPRSQQAADALARRLATLPDRHRRRHQHQQLRAEGSDAEARADRGRGQHPGADAGAAQRRPPRSRRPISGSPPRRPWRRSSHALPKLPKDDPLAAIAGDLQHAGDSAGRRR